ncbi:MAG: OmpA family protein [Bacteroides sp.]|nr:OmpA family protein [Bacteroides sp.]
MKKYIILLILIFSMGSLRAQTDIFNWKLTAGGGSFVYEDHFGFPEDLKHAVFGLHIERTLNRSFSTGLSLFTGRPMGGILKNTGYAGLTFGFRWDNGWLLGERVFLAPYHSLEAGYLTGEKRSDGSVHHDFAAGTTHGLKFRLSDRLSARLGFGLYYPLDENQDRKWSELMFYHQWKAGISYYFGARKIRYRGPVFNAGQIFSVQRETVTPPELSPLTEQDSLPQPLAQPKVIVEETIIVMEEDSLPEEPRIQILKTDSLLQISVKEGETVIINISPEMFGKPAAEKNKEEVLEKGRKQEEAEEPLEEPETGTKGEETITTKTGEVQEEIILEPVEETTEEVEEEVSAETEEGLSEEISEKVAEGKAEEALPEVAEQIEETENVEDFEELEETEAVVETVIVEEEVEEEVPETIEETEIETSPEETTEEVEEELFAETEEELSEEIPEEVAEEKAEETLPEVAEQIEETEPLEAVEELEETEAVVETVMVEEKVEEEIPETIEETEEKASPEEAIEEQVVKEEQEKKQVETRARSLKAPETTQVEEAVTEPEPIPAEILPIMVPDSLEYRYPIVLTFPFNSASLQEGHQDVLHQVAKDLEAHPGLLCKISGFADKSGDTIYNMILSGQRAEAIMECLAGFGIDPDRIIIEALGDRFASEEFSEEERKVEIKIIASPAPGEHP